MLATKLPEKIHQHGLGSRSGNAADNLGLVVAGRLIEEPHAIFNGSGLGVLSREVDPA